MGLSSVIKLKVATLLINKVLKALTGDKLKEYMDKVFDKIEQHVTNTENKIDDKLMVAVAVLRSAFGVTDTDAVGTTIAAELEKVKIAAIRDFLKDGIEYLTSDKIRDLVSDGVAYLKEYIEKTDNKYDDLAGPLLSLINATFGADDETAEAA